MKKSILLHDGNPALVAPFSAGPGSCDCVKPGPFNCDYAEQVPGSSESAKPGPGRNGYTKMIFPEGDAYDPLQGEVAF